MKKRFLNISLITIVLGLLLSQAGALAQGMTATTRIKDIARLQGVRNNQLNGMGLVIGLNGTGDSSKANAQLVANALAKWGIEVPVNELKVKNVAAVIVTATLPPYTHQGDAIDVQVASMGDSKSLQGGILLQTPLTGADGKVYAVAQGSVYLGGYVAGSKGSSVQKNVTTTGSVIGGAIVEREVPMQLEMNGRIRWALNSPDFTTASRLAKSINDNIAEGAARAIDMGLVEVVIPNQHSHDPIPFIAEIESLPVTPDGLAKVIINERTGTVIIGDKVKIASVAVTHRNITVKISTSQQVSQPSPFSEGETQKINENKVKVSEEEGRMIILPEGTNIGTIVRALNAVGTTPQDIIAILVAIKQAGALYGVLEFV